MPAKTMTGARAILWIGGGTDAAGKAAAPVKVGIFNNVSYGLQYDAQPVYILGRFSPAEIEYTGQEPVGVTASGWRVVGHGPHVDGKVPSLRELLTHEYLLMTIHDRAGAANDPPIAHITGVRPTGYTTSLSERQLQNMQLSFIGMLVGDESNGTNEEAADSVVLP